MQPYCGNIMSIKIPYVRKDASTLLVLSAAILILLLASPVLLSNLLIQPVQAQTTLTFRTSTPAHSEHDDCLDSDATLTFDAQGTPSSIDPHSLDITTGTFKITSIRDEQQSYSGKLEGGSFTNNSGGGVESFDLVGLIDNVYNVTNCRSIQGDIFSVLADCSTSNDGVLNPVNFNTYYRTESGQAQTSFNGVVECSSSQGGGNTTATQQSSSSSMTAGSSQDSDSDGIPDSSDNCTHNSNPRCFKEGGDTSTTTTTHEQEQPPSSSSNNRTGNQTR
jgi:hypothetical protein